MLQSALLPKFKRVTSYVWNYVQCKKPRRNPPLSGPDRGEFSPSFQNCTAEAHKACNSFLIPGIGQRWLLYVSAWFLQLNYRNSFSVAHRRYESFHRYVTRDAQTNTKSDNYTEHADRLLVFMRIPVRKSQFDFRIYRIDFCHEAL